MKNNCWNIVVLCCFALPLLIGSGCTGSSSENDNDFLIRVGDRVITTMDFKTAFEIAKSAYPHNEMQNSSAFKAAQSRLLNQLTEELILLERAGELDISVTDSEMDAAVSRIKKDYPDEVFDQTLLEYAVSYDTWKQRLKIRLLMEKVVEQELEDHISITANDILSYYEAHYQLKPQTEQDTEKVNKVIVEQLRKKKAEDAYRAWIKKLQDRYSIQINTEQWESIIGS